MKEQFKNQKIQKTDWRKNIASKIVNLAVGCALMFESASAQYLQNR